MSTSIASSYIPSSVSSASSYIPTKESVSSKLPSIMDEEQTPIDAKRDAKKREKKLNNFKTEKI